MLDQKYSVTVERLGISMGTGTLAKQANGAVTVRLGDTIVFVSAVAAATLKPDQDFFPLTVDYREKFSAAGRFPGGFFKREGRPTEKEILTSRLCDRPLRPLFPAGFMNEVQVLGMLLSTDQENEPDILLVNGASAALMVSDIPWNGPVGCVRIGLVDGRFIVNPTHEQMYESDLDLIYVGNEKDMMMIEGSAEQLPEETFVAALEFAHQNIQGIIAAQRELAAKCARPKRVFPLVQVTPENLAAVRGLVGERLGAAVFLESKSERQEAVAALTEEAKTKLKESQGEAFDENQVRMAMEALQESLYREAILEKGKRADGRSVTDLRDIECQVSVLPRVHGSAFFQRGETQNIAITTLGTTADVQEMDGITGGAKEKSFILHYNFPPYSVGETGRTGSPGRREIGHGALAERSLLPVMPSEDDFPYSIRVVSEIFESNGSTSMASVCAGCLSLMDAGVPISDMVAGISCGLVTQRNESGEITKHVILTDIIGSEDHYGDMDFKICGSRKGITGFQLDLKIHGLPLSIAKEAIRRNTETRLKILEIMEKTMSAPRAELSPYAPRIQTIQIDPEKIGLLIGPGGKTIRRIQDVSGAQIDINEDNSGRVNIYATSAESMARAIEEINLLTLEIEVGKTYRGVVRGVKEFGAFVEVLPGKEGLVHVSELADFRVNRVEDVCSLGDTMWVKCVGVDEKGRVRLSRKEAMAERTASGNVEGDGLSDRLAAAKERGEIFRSRRERSEGGPGEGEHGGENRPHESREGRHNRRSGGGQGRSGGGHRRRGGPGRED